MLHGTVSTAGRRSFCGFFFQAEDGIRDWSVTGVQTCALPIFTRYRKQETTHPISMSSHRIRLTCGQSVRSEERRVGKECRSRGSPCQEKEKSSGDRDG